MKDATAKDKYPEFEGLGLTDSEQVSYDRFRFWKVRDRNFLFAKESIENSQS
jgi:hypothetical protein